MTPATNNPFRSWFKSNNTIKLSYDADVVCMTYESITNFASRTKLDKKNIEYIPSNLKEKNPTITDDTAAGTTAETAVHGANISLVRILRLMKSVFQTAKYYTSIGRMKNATNMHYTNVLSKFKIKWGTYEELKN